jgi:hypothetical protein
MNRRIKVKEYRDAIRMTADAGLTRGLDIY